MRLGTIPILILMLSTIAPMQVHATETSSPEEIVLGMIDAVNQRNFEALDSLVSSNIKRHSAATPGVKVENLEQFKASLHDLAAVPDAKQSVNFIFSADDMVAVHVTYEGTQTGQMGPFPPSGRKMHLPFIGILRVENGKVEEIWVEWDNLGPLIQLGHFAPPGAAGDDPENK